MNAPDVPELFPKRGAGEAPISPLQGHCDLQRSMLQRQCSRSICCQACHLKAAACAITRSTLHNLERTTPRFSSKQDRKLVFDFKSNVYDARFRPLPQRRVIHCSASAAAGRHKLVFLGTPQVRAFRYFGCMPKSLAPLIITPLHAGGCICA